MKFLSKKVKTENGNIIIQSVDFDAKYGTFYNVEIKKFRSIDANAYMWVLCDKIAEAVKSSKEEVYKEIIQRVGVFEIVPIKKEAVEKWVKNWKARGIGWLCVTAGESKIDGYENIICYYGSSTYDPKEMARLVDEVISECQNLKIETLPPSEIELLKTQWG